MEDHKQKALLISLSAFCVLGHFLSPPDWVFAHEFLFKLTYLPIVLSAIWIGRGFSLQLTALFCVVYIFHIYVHLFHHPGHHHVASIALDLGLYFAVAWMTGSLSDRQKSISKRLSVAYEDLKDKTHTLVEFEERARKTERLRTMGELAGTVAHEIRTPLSGIQGAVEIITSPSSSDEAKAKFSKTVFAEVQRINGVVEDFLKIGREGLGEKETFLLSEFLKDSITLLEPILKKKNMVIELDISPNVKVLSNKDQLKQVVINLVMNAFYACQNKDGRLSMVCRGDMDHVLITDNGIGIPEALRDRLFQAFQTGRANGNGLGLYLSRNIMRSLDGELSLVDSQPGHTQFKLSFPKGAV